MAPGGRLVRTRGVALTDAGDMLVHHALRVLGEIKDAEANLQALLGAGLPNDEVRRLVELDLCGELS